MADNNGLDKDTLEKVNKLLGKTEDNLNDFQKSLKEGADATDKAKERLAALSKYAKDLGAVHLSNEQGMAKYGKSITTATDAIGDAASEFGILGKVVGFLIKQIGGLAAASLKQQDALMKSYRTLSDFGAIDSSGLQGVLDKMLAMGGNSEQVENFHKVLKDMAPDLVTFGGTVAAGAKKFSEVTNVMLTKGIEDNLKKLGYSTEDIVKYSGQYIAMQAKSGSLRTKNEGELAVQSAAYMKTLSELTMLTGASRDQAQEAFEQQQRDLAFRLKMQEMESSGQEAQAKRTKEIVAGIMMTNKDLGQAVMEQIANDGGMVTEKTARLMSQYPELYQKVIALQQGTGDTAVGTIEMLKSEVPNIQRIIDQFGSTGKISAEAAAQLGLNVETLNMLEKLRNTDTEKFRQEMEKLSKGNDPRIQAQTELERSERNTKKGMEQLTFAMGEVAVPIVNTLARAMNRLGAVIADVIYWVTSHMPGVDTVDIRAAFKEFGDLAEVTKTLKEEQEKQKNLQKEIDEGDKKLLEMKKKEEELVKASTYTADVAKRGGWTAEEKEKALAANKELIELRKQKEELQSRNKTAKSEMANSKAMSQAAQAASVGMTGGGAAVTVGEDNLQGLRMKKGDVQKAGAYLSPKLIELARQIQDKVPGFGYFSSLNDQFHQDKKSNHNKGLALDFVLGKDITGDKKAGEEILTLLKSMGATNVIDEYNNPSSNATAGHIHAEVSAKTQGLFKGPESGYWLKAHGEEALLNQQGLSNLITKSQVALNGTDGGGMDAVVEALYEMGEKLDEVIKELKNSHGTQEKILQYSRV